MNFKHPEVDARYTIVADQDLIIEVAGKYTGKLSDVQDPAIIAGMIQRKSKLVAEKKPAASPKPADTPNGDKAGKS